jgi:hypothetical protein
MSRWLEHKEDINWKGGKWAQINSLILSKAISSISAAWRRWIMLMWIAAQHRAAQEIRKVFGRIERNWLRSLVKAVFGEWKQIYAEERSLRLENAELQRAALQVA